MFRAFILAAGLAVLSLAEQTDSSTNGMRVTITRVPSEFPRSWGVPVPPCGVQSPDVMVGIFNPDLTAHEYDVTVRLATSDGLIADYRFLVPRNDTWGSMTTTYVPTIGPASAAGVRVQRIISGRVLPILPDQAFSFSF